ncbi:MAG: helix-turn-helix domain-containing protein [Candidatus Aminicenantes bacterium]|jgi:DNA-binding NtrC family response regulator|nr:helix-turn-helix domain-containing protein [Candidatus Aminicenantes bacterium]
MDRRSSDLNLHQRMELIIKDMVEKEINIKDALREFEKIFFEQAAKKHEGNKTKMARALGIHRNTLHNRAKLLKIKKKY